MDAVESLKEKMVLACKVLQSQGVVDVYGHVSARLQKVKFHDRRKANRRYVDYYVSEVVD